VEHSNPVRTAHSARPLPRTALALAFFACVAVALRLHDFGNPVIHVDEQYYLLVGDRMLHGALPYVDFWDRKPLGLFLLFAGVRLLPGDGILAYQLTATLFAALTAGLIALSARRLGARTLGAAAAGCAYLLWLGYLSGRGGQSPVFYNLFMAAAGWLTLRLPALTAARDRRAIMLQGAAACLLAGLAIQTKYTPVVEGAFFGLAHLWYLRRAGGRLPLLFAAGALWALLGLAPTLAAVAWYHAQGPAAFSSFWFSNFASVALRRSYPAAKIVDRLAGTTAQLSPFLFCGVLSWRWQPTERRAELRVALGWLAAALIGFAMIGAFFDHYALPLLVPFAIVAAPALGRSRIVLGASAVAAAILFVVHWQIEPDDRATARAAARIVAAHADEGCPYVFAGDSVLYLLGHACVPTAYAFPSTLAYEAEQGATGIDEAGEVRRIMAQRPPVVVTMDPPLAPWNRQSLAVMAPLLARDYRLELRAPREETHLLVYVRRDLAR
jgi:4-amino-4-deoxy-L-arabinose transferase-like glycosyltransferase